MNNATAALHRAATPNSAGMLNPVASNPAAAPAPTTMNKAFKMLLAAMTRARWTAAERSWIKAYRGTMKKPPKRPVAKRANKICHVPGVARSSATPSGIADGWDGEAKASSRAKSVRPPAPKGTRPISTWPADRRSHSREPMPIPSVKVPSSIVTLVSLPPSTSLA